MEINPSSEAILTSLRNKLNSNRSITAELKKPVFDIIANFNELSNKKVNLIVFGSVSVGKTTLVNLMIRHLVTERLNRAYNFQTAQNKSNSSSNSNNALNEEDEEPEEEERYDGYIELSTKEVENTYFVNSIESSDSGKYQIIIGVNCKEDKEALKKLEPFRKLDFDHKNQIIMYFSNEEQDIRRMNMFLKDIDSQCFNITRNRKKVDMDYNQANQQEYIPSKMTIKIPDFPEELRLIDSPGLSTKSFRNALIKMIFNLNYINIYLVVNDIYSRESYSITDDILKEICNDHGSPIVYSFFTKGDKFLTEFPKINKNYNAYVRTNNCIFNNLEEIKPRMNFRKVIPINDKVYNEDVKKCLTKFFKDLTEIKSNHGFAN